MEKQKTANHYWKMGKFSLCYVHFAIIDTGDYLADQLFIRHQVRVSFGKEFIAPDMKYRVIFCRVTRRDEAVFLSALDELPDKMLLCGHTDYLDICKILHGKISEEVVHEKLGTAK